MILKVSNTGHRAARITRDMSSVPLSVGQKVELNDSRIGIVRFVGTTSFQTGDWVGIELEEQSGKNDGSVKGQRYFDCAPQYGIFCRPSGVSQVLEEAAKPKARVAGNGAAVKPRPSSINNVVNGARRQTLQQERRASAVPGTPTPAARLTSGIRSPTKSPTKQLGMTGAPSTSTSRTSTPPVATKRPLSGIAAKSRPSIAPSATAAARRTSTILPASAPRNARSSAAAAVPKVHAARSTAASARSAPSARSALRQRLSATNESSTGDASSERGDLDSVHESSSSASQDGTEDHEVETQETPRPNFAPPSAPPIPLEPAERLTRSRRPSSPTAASIHSQRTIRSTAASNRQIEELEGKLRLLERKRMEDRELREQLEKATSERDRFKGTIDKLQAKYHPQQQELEKLKRELSEYEQRFVAIEDMQADHEIAMESAVLDREVAEETAEGYKADLEAVRARNEELELEVEVAREERIEMGREMSPEERSSTGWLQLERMNGRLKDALISLRDISQDKEAALKEQIGGLEREVDGIDILKNQFEETKEKLLRSEADTNDLRQQLEAAMDAESIIESLEEDNSSMRSKLNELRAAIEDLEALRELNDELEINHVEAERQLQEELDFKDSLLQDRERTALEQQKALDEADYNISRFREYVTTLQSDLQDLQASKQITEAEASQLSNKARAMMDLNMKLQSSAAKTQVKAIDLELRKLDAEQASEHLAIVQMFLPETFQAERDSVLALLRFRRIGFKANLVQSFVKDRISSFGTRGQDEDVFAACDALDKLTWIVGMSQRLVNSISGCSSEAFAQYGGALYELEVVERTLNDYVDALRRDELQEGEMSLRLGRSIEVMTHLSSLHLHNGPADHADELIMRATLLQSQLESATAALTVTKSLLENSLALPAAESEDEEDAASDAILIVNRLKIIIEQVRNAKVASSKIYRALSDLQASSLTLNSNLMDHFEAVKKVSSTVVAFACQSGAELQAAFGEEGRTEPVTPSEVAASLSKTATSIFSLPTQEAGPYSTLVTRLRDLVSLVADLAILPTDLDNTVEFERAPQPWLARAEELKRTKTTSVDKEAELARTLEAVKERDSLVRDKEKELEEQSVRIEMLEARMKDASRRSAKIAELERSLREAKENEMRMKKEFVRIQHEAQREIERSRQEMARLGEERKQTVSGPGTNDDSMSAGTQHRIRRDQQRLAGMSSALRHLRETNVRLHLPAPDAPFSVAAKQAWLHERLDTASRSSRQDQAQRAAGNAIERLLSFAALAPPVDLTKLPENKLAWRPVKESSRVKIEQKNEEWVDWKQTRDWAVESAPLRQRRPLMVK